MIKLCLSDAEADALLQEQKVEAELSVRALGPLSLVSASPGGYYQSQTLPSDFQIYGLLENALGWWELPLTKKLKKRLKPAPEANSGYQPILQLFLELGALVEEPQIAFCFEDLWHQHVRREVTAYHIGGLASLPPKVESEFVGILRRAAELPQKDRDKFTRSEADRFKGDLPRHYPTSTRREYVVWNGPYRRRFFAPQSLLQTLKARAVDPAGLPYLGHTESWVDLSVDDAPSLQS
jgi:CRISPR-associated protein Cas5